MKKESNKVSILKKSMIIIACIIIVLIIILCIYHIKSSNIKVEGKYTRYKLTSIASYGGYGIAGQDLGSGKIVKSYYISENNCLIADDGIWEFKTLEDNSIYEATIKINKFEENTVKLEINGKGYTAKYNEKINIKSNMTVTDGINYSYIIEISKDK